MPLFSPDFAPAAVVASSNFGVRAGGQRPDCVLLHYTGMPDGAAALALLCDPASSVSCHYLVFEDGRIVQLVAERWRAWHAGKSYWKRETDLNSRSIGIEIVHPGHDAQNDMPPYPPAQIVAVIDLCRDIAERHAIPADRFLAHSDVAPERKIDPGERFPWPDLHRAGIGHWVEPLPPEPLTEASRHRATAQSARPLQEMLALYGYRIGVTSCFDERTRIVVTAFQRHFRPARVDGIADRSTIVTLQNLLREMPKPSAPVSQFFSGYDEEPVE
jgi:N-acetylmuramoyl-L-alanine amidase